MLEINSKAHEKVRFVTVLKGIIGYSDYSFEIVIFKYFETGAYPALSQWGPQAMHYLTHARHIHMIIMQKQKANDPTSG